MSQVDDFHLLCTLVGFGSNWFNLLGLLLDIAGFFTLWLSAEKKLELTERAEKHRQEAEKASSEAEAIDRKRAEALVKMDLEVHSSLAHLRISNPAQVQRTLSQEKLRLSRDAERYHSRLRSDALRSLKAGEEVSILGLSVERKSLNVSAFLILAGFVFQVAGSFPGCA
ncbi:hypothetical protein LB543_26810 [Mesorhizobium sp. ESP7-2]|uniref:hypothetical protein n=1 Tax=Mesorhizobium sp. ESP7-2 TaxID=2876622 RepID=UPI001CCBC9B2|nr:hypothetical protein [Mesorhizobium sp. ESP7-2]MBZ9710321.1 hypothetical protein [Mesorhizobium sp. ESP7-2]